MRSVLQRRQTYLKLVQAQYPLDRRQSRPCIRYPLLLRIPRRICLGRHRRVHITLEAIWREIVFDRSWWMKRVEKRSGKVSLVDAADHLCLEQSVPV